MVCGLALLSVDGFGYCNSVCDQFLFFVLLL